MQGKLTGASLFLVNGTKCLVSLNDESVSWTREKCKKCSNKGEKRIPFAQIVGTKQKLAEKKILSDDITDRTVASPQLVRKLKIYHAKQSDNKPGLLKLKKLSIGLIGGKKCISRKQTRTDDNQRAALREDQALEAARKQEESQSSNPPSCYESESGTASYLSLKSSSQNQSRSSSTASPVEGLAQIGQDCDTGSSLSIANKAPNCDTDDTRTLATVDCEEKARVERNQDDCYHVEEAHHKPGSQAQLEELIHFIEEALERERQRRPKRLLIFVNPFGGKGRAAYLYKSQVSRVLELAKVETKLVITKYANHARDTIEDPQFNVQYFDGIVCVGGDGMFSELMNGLLNRFNREKILTARQFESDALTKSAVNDDSSSESNNNNPISDSEKLTRLKGALGGIGQPFISPTIPIGVIGAGSTDANSFGLIGTNDVTTATLNIILGNLIDIDVCSIHTLNEDRLLRFVSTFVAYGYFGDVIRESEKLRWLGPSRYDVTGLNNLIKNRTYKGQVNILYLSSDGSPLNVEERCHKECAMCQNAPTRLQQEDVSLHELKLIERKGAFVGVNAAVTACRCPQTKKGFSPANHLANGCADLILVRPCSRLQYIQYLLRTGWTKKSPFDLDYVEAFRCRQFEFVADNAQQQQLGEKRSEPNTNNQMDLNSSTSSSSSSSSSSALSTSSTSSVNQSSTQSNSLDSSKAERASAKDSKGAFSSWNADGEIMDEQSIRVKVNNQLLRVFGTGEPQLAL